MKTETATNCAIMYGESPYIKQNKVSISCSATIALGLRKYAFCWSV